MVKIRWSGKTCCIAWYLHSYTSPLRLAVAQSMKCINIVTFYPKKMLHKCCYVLGATKTKCLSSCRLCVCFAVQPKIVCFRFKQNNCDSFLLSIDSCTRTSTHSFQFEMIHWHAALNQTHMLTCIRSDAHYMHFDGKTKNIPFRTEKNRMEKTETKDKNTVYSPTVD